MNNARKVLQTLVEDGIFGKVKFVSTTLGDDQEKGFQLASSIHFVNIIVKNGTIEEKRSVVIKLQISESYLRELMLGNKAFNNEVLVYKHIFPLLNVSKIELFPKLYYANYSGGEDFEKDIVVLQDLGELDYTVSKNKIFLDLNHMTIVLKKLGEFHGLSYLLKRENPAMFHKLGSQLAKSSFECETNIELQLMCSISMERGIERVKQQGVELEILDKFCKGTERVDLLAGKILVPEEPFAVITHGDLNRNNVLFKYDGNGYPINTKFFDLQNAQYTSPVNDLAFLLYMSTTQEDRDKYWNDYLNIYWNGIISILSNPGFTFDEFYQHLAKRAVLGYVPCSFFLPWVIEDPEDKNPDLSSMTYEEKRARYLNMGGEEGTKRIGDIVQHLLDKQYIHKYFEL